MWRNRHFCRKTVHYTLGGDMEQNSAKSRQELLQTSYDVASKGMNDNFGVLLHLYDICVGKVLSKYDLYPGQPKILFALENYNILSQNDLAELIGVTKASVSTSLKRLEKNGFVKRMRDEKDTRCIRITLTEKGRQYAKWCKIDMEMIFTTMLQGLTNEQRALIPDITKSMLTELESLRRRLNN